MQNILLMLAAFIIMSTNAKNPSEQIIGNWINKDKSRILEFVKNGSEYEAIVIESDVPSHIGKKQITSLKYDKQNTFKGGTAHILRKNKTAKCSVKLLSQNELELKVKAGLKSKSKIWTRVEE